MSYPFYFKVLTYDYEEHKYFTSAGLGLCSSWGDACDQIDKEFGEELASIEHLELFDNDNLIFLPEDYCEKFANAEYPHIDFSVETDEKGNKI